MLLLPLVLDFCTGQLVGNRGVVQLPDGFQYRDQETVQAIQAATRFAKHFQPINDIVAEQNKLVELQRNQYQQEKTPVFFTFGQQNFASEKNDTLFFNDIRYIPVGENLRATPKQEQTYGFQTSTMTQLADFKSLQASSGLDRSATLKRLPVGVSLPTYSTTFHFNLNNIYGL